MFNKNAARFQNYWLDSTEINLRFTQRTGFFYLNKNRVYLQQNDWLYCGERTDDFLQKNGTLVRRPLREITARLRRLFDIINDKIQSIKSYAIRERHPVNYQEIYQEYQRLYDDIMPALARINKRVNARREAAGIISHNQKCLLPEEALTVALRAVLKNRK